MIKTDRLFLREMNENDFDALYAVLADSDIMQHYPYTFDEARVKGWISRNIERYQIFGFGLWAVCLKENGEMIGDCGLTMQSINGVIKPEIGYHIRRDHQRKGQSLQQIGAVQHPHAAGHGHHQGLTNKGQGGNTHDRGAAEAARNLAVKQHHRDFQHGLEGGDTAKIPCVAADFPEDID